MKHETTAFTAPTWDGGYELDVTGELFLDLDDEGDTEVTAVFRDTDSTVDADYLIDGVRLKHTCGLTEWRDRAYLAEVFGSSQVADADVLASRSMGVDV